MQISHFMLNFKNSAVDFSKANPSFNTDKTKSKGSLGGLIKSYTKKSSSSKDRISNLMERKQNIADMKADYQVRAKEQGIDKDTIKEKLADYDAQIAQIDQQIADIKQDEQKKAVQGKDKNSTGGKVSQKSDGNTDETAQINGGTGSTNQALMKAFSSTQNTQRHIEAVQFAQNVLQTEALSYKPSQAFQSNPEKYAALTAKVDGLQNHISKMTNEFRKTGDVLKDSSSRPAEEKTAQEKAVENYKRVAAGDRKEDDSDADDLNVLA